MCRPSGHVIFKSILCIQLAKFNRHKLKESHTWSSFGAAATVVATVVDVDAADAVLFTLPNNEVALSASAHPIIPIMAAKSKGKMF